MNTQKLRLLHSTIIVALFSILFSCKKDETNEPINPSIKFMVNGTLKNANGSGHIWATRSTGNTIFVKCNFPDTRETIIFTIPGIKGRGEFPFPESATAVYTNGPDQATNTYTAVNGSVKITTFQANGVKGSFEFYSLNSGNFHKDITEGSFEAKFDDTK